MAEPDKRQFGDGSDNYSQAASDLVRAANEARNQAASAAAGASVSGGIKVGKAVAGIAKGAAAGGPWGAIASAAWSMRHTLYKLLVCTALFFLFIIVTIVSLPSIVTNGVFGLDGSKPVEGATLTDTYGEMAAAVSAAVNHGYDLSLAEADRLIEAGGYDYKLSMDSLVNYGHSSSGYDTCYVLAAYSASMEQQGTSKEDMVAKLESVAGAMFPVTSVEKEHERIIPLTYYSYAPVTLTVITSAEDIGDGQFSYETGQRTYYYPYEVYTSEEPVTVDAYQPVDVRIPVYDGGTVTGFHYASYYVPVGTETLYPDTEIVKYLECTIHPFDNSVIHRAFGIDPSATYDQFHITFGEAIQHMANALKMTLYGSLEGGKAVPLTDEELIAFVNRQDCSPARKHILSTALSLVGKVPYFWGGKSAPGWNDAWNTPRLVTSEGSSSSGTIRPYGLDCSGFTSWVYNTAMGVEIGAGTSGQFPNTMGIDASELLPGDLAFLAGDEGWEHVLIFAGYDESGNRLWVHCTAGSGVVLNIPDYESSLVFRRLTIVDYDADVGGEVWGEPLSELTVVVTHYCACPKCCGENSDGITASGKYAQRGMVAMSSYYPFGTQIMINGVMYTVEDRGGPGIEDNIHRVDIFVPDHQEALRLGTYNTTAYIYRMGW